MTEEIKDTIPDAEQLPQEDALESTPDDMQTPMYNKIQMSDAIKRERAKAYEKGKREALMDLDNQQAAPQTQQAPMAQPQMLGGMPQMSQADIERLIAEQLPQHMASHINNLRNEQTVNSFVSKMQAAEQKYPGIQERLNDLDYTSMAPLIKMANEMDNTADIMKELMDNPHKIGTLLPLMYSQPKLAQRELQSLSNSLKQNEIAKAQETQANAPLTQIKPSISAKMADNTALSVQDLRKIISKRK